MSEHNQAAHQQRARADQILDQVARDPAFHQQLLDNTALALQVAGFAEEPATGEVVGYAAPDARKCGALTCGPYTCMYTLNTCVVTATRSASRKA